jgi:hypothetical protein
MEFSLLGPGVWAGARTELELPGVSPGSNSLPVHFRIPVEGACKREGAREGGGGGRGEGCRVYSLNAKPRLSFAFILPCVLCTLPGAMSDASATTAACRYWDHGTSSWSMVGVLTLG